MKRTTMMLSLMLVGAGGLAAMAQEAGRAPDGAAAFARMKTLEGRWVSGSGDKQATTVFELTANGTVLLERYSNPKMPGGGHMVTAYHLDGGDLVLTHYCIANNQPVLRADRFDPAGREIQFEFVRASNLAAPTPATCAARCTASTTPRQFTTEWEFFEAGEQEDDRSRDLHPGHADRPSSLRRITMPKFMLLLHDDTSGVDHHQPRRDAADHRAATSPGARSCAPPAS